MYPKAFRTFTDTRAHFEIPRSPRAPREHTMKKYRIVIEDERTGEEFKAYAGLSRQACERACAMIDSASDHDLKLGRLPARKAPAKRRMFVDDYPARMAAVAKGR